MKLSLGTGCCTTGRRSSLLQFYADLVDAPFDVVYLGEVVCSRRTAMRFDDWMGLARDLRDAGKEVVLSTQALLESEADLRALRRMTGNGEFAVEANDLGAVRLLARAGAPFVAGPHLNIYNAGTLEWFAGQGATRWLPAVEASREIVLEMQSTRPAGMQTEVFVFGRMPLAFSARCFTARHHNLNKDSCEFPLSRRSGRHHAAHARRRAVPDAERHSDAVGAELQPARRGACAAVRRYRCAAAQSAVDAHA
jgi:collagenase-like PrtC family protease